MYDGMCYDAVKRKTRRTQKGLIEKHIYIQVTETRYKWTWLNSSQLIGTLESSGVVTIRPLRKWYHMWLYHVDWWTGVCYTPHQAYKCGTRPFLGGSSHRAIAQMCPAVPKMPQALSAFLLKEAPQVPDDEPNPSEEG